MLENKIINSVLFMRKSVIQTKELIKRTMISFFNDALQNLGREKSDPILVTNREIEKEYLISKSKFPLGWIWLLSDKSCIFYNQEKFYYFSSAPKLIRAWTENGVLCDLFGGDEDYRKLKFDYRVYDVRYKEDNEPDFSHRGMVLMIWDLCGFSEWAVNDLLYECRYVELVKHKFFGDSGDYLSDEEEFRLLELFKEYCDSRHIPLSGDLVYDSESGMMQLMISADYPNSYGEVYSDVSYVFRDDKTKDIRPETEFASPKFIKKYWKAFKKQLEEQDKDFRRKVFFEITGFDKQDRPKIMLFADNKKHYVL